MAVIVTNASRSSSILTSSSAITSRSVSLSRALRGYRCPPERRALMGDQARDGTHPSVSTHRSVSCGGHPHHALRCNETLGWKQPSVEVGLGPEAALELGDAGR